VKINVYPHPNATSPRAGFFQVDFIPAMLKIQALLGGLGTMLRNQKNKLQKGRKGRFKCIDVVVKGQV